MSRQAQYGKMLSGGSQQLREAISMWLTENKGSSPVDLIAWIGETTEEDPFVLMSENDYNWLQDVLVQISGLPIELLQPELEGLTSWP